MLFLLCIILILLISQTYQITYNIPCTQQIYDTYSPTLENLQPPSDTFIIDPSNQPPTSSNITIQFLFNQQNQQCSLKTLKITPQNDQNTYNLTINSLNIINNQQQQINDPSLLPQLTTPNLFQFSGLTTLEINNLHIVSLQTSLIFSNMHSFTLKNTQFENSNLQTYMALFNLKAISHVQIANSNFTKIQNLNGSNGVLAILNSLTVSIHNTQMIENFSLIQCAAMYLENIDLLNVTDSNFSKNTIALYFPAAISLRNIKISNFTNTKFIQNTKALNGGVISLFLSEQIHFNRCQFIKNQVYNYGSCIFFLTLQEMTIENSLFDQNNALQEGGVAFIYHIEKVLLKNNNFTNNYVGLNGGVIFQRQNPSLQVENCQFRNNFALKGSGGALFLANAIIPSIEYSLILKNNTFSNNFAKEGGAISFSKILITKPENSIIQDCIFTQNEAKKGRGGAIFIENLQDSLQISSNSFQKNTAQVAGGAIAVLNSLKINLISSNFQENQSHKASVLYLENNSNQITLKNLTILKNKAQNEASIAIGKSQNISISDLLITENTSERTTAGIQIISSKNINLTHISIKNNTAQYSTSFQFLFCEQFQLKNITISENFAEKDLPGFQIYQSNDLKMTNFTVKNNEAQQNKAGIQIQLSNKTYLSDFLLQNNTAQNSKSGIIIQMCEEIDIKQGEILQNSAGDDASAMFILASKSLFFEEISFLNNENKGKLGGAITLQKSENLTLKDSFFEKNKAKYKGGAIYAVESKNLTLISLEFIENSAEIDGGALYFRASQQIEIEDSNFIKNTASESTAAIHMTDSQKILIKNSEFIENSAQNFGAAFSFLDNSDQIELKSLKIHNNLSKNKQGILYLSQIKSISLTSLNFTTNQQQQQDVSGPILIIKDANYLQIEDSDFKNHKSEQGPAITSKNTEKILIKDSFFRENQAQLSGGALFLENSQNITIKNTIFSNNTAPQKPSKGGTIYLQNSTIFSFLNSKIQNSQAFIQGGGIYLHNVKNAEIQASNFMNNTVHFNETLKIEQKTQDYILSMGGSIYFEPEIHSDASISIQDSLFESSIASSGGAILINKKPDSDIEILINNSNFIENKADLGPNLRFLGLNSQNSKKLAIKALKTSNFKAFLAQNSSKNGLYFGYHQNEKLLNDQSSHFQLCESNQYLQTGGQTQCQKCLPEGQCPGGYIKMYPKKHYWRQTKTEYNFVYCKNNPEVCLGNDECEEGHIGLLCENCDRKNDYSFYNSSKICKKCAKNHFSIILQLFLIFMLIVLFLFNQIYGVILRVNKKLIQKFMQIAFDLHFDNISQLSASTKILLMHIQILYTVVQSDSEILQYVLKSFRSIASPQTHFSRSLECLISYDESETAEYYQKQMSYYLSFYGLLILLCTAVFLILCEFLFFLLKKIIKSSVHLYQYIKLTILCFILFILPTMLQNSLDYLKLREINGQNYCFANTFIRSDSDFYQNELKPINISIVILLGFIIPSILFLILYKANKKNSLKRISTERTLGLLYLEYKNENYYWELIVILLKIVTVVLNNQLDHIPIIKGMLIVFILGVYLFLCLKIMPYKTKQLNDQAIYSILIMSLTIGILINNDESNISQTFELILTITVLTLNFFFILFSVYIMIQDFQRLLIYRLKDYFFFPSVLQKYINKKISKEFNAKLKWRVLKMKLQVAIQQKKDQNQPLRKILDPTYYHNQTYDLDQSRTSIFQFLYQSQQSPLKSPKKMSHLDSFYQQLSKKDLNFDQNISNQTSSRNEESQHF